MSRRGQGHCLTDDSFNMPSAYIFSKAMGPVVNKFHVQPPGAEGMKIRSN